MTVYHGSTLKINQPDVTYSKSFLDFGKGFYSTTYKEQAESWALRKNLRVNKKAIVNVYNLKDNLTDYTILSFENENEKWFDFVCDCRSGNNIYDEYDIIIGNVADDDVFKTINLYFNGIWTKQQALEQLKYYKMNDQICITKQHVLDEILIFDYSYEVK